MTTYWCERAWLGPGGLSDDVIVEVDGSRIVAVRSGPAPAGAVQLTGLTIPGFANCHSHAFHRALRGRTQRGGGSFWTWREAMYGVAARLEPDTYYDLAHATYREMAAAGITAVGEFHYLHHRRDGGRYDDPNAMGAALVAAARDAGLRIALLDTCYLSAGFGEPPTGVQIRFDDGSASGWAERVAAYDAGGDPGVVVGAAIHSVRAVPRDALSVVAEAFDQAPLHVHLSEQAAENQACQRAHGCTPTQLLADEGVLTDRLSAVHATHLADADLALLGDAAGFAAFCPTTERDLADGIGPSRGLAEAGARLTLGTDSHAFIDMFEEMRAVELDERLATSVRGHWQAGELIGAATATGHASLGFADAGRIETGCWADLVTIGLTSVRTGGTGAGEETVVFCATAADVTSVVAGGVLLDLDRVAIGGAVAAAVERVVARP